MAITKKTSLSHLDSLAAAATAASETIHAEAQVWGNDAFSMRRSLHNTLVARGVPEDRAERVTWHLARELSDAAAQLVTASQRLDAIHHAVGTVLNEANDIPRREGVGHCDSLPTGMS